MSTKEEPYILGSICCWINSPTQLLIR